jgi:hypothetical protein
VRVEPDDQSNRGRVRSPQMSRCLGYMTSAELRELRGCGREQLRHAACRASCPNLFSMGRCRRSHCFNDSPTQLCSRQRWDNFLERYSRAGDWLYIAWAAIPVPANNRQAEVMPWWRVAPMTARSPSGKQRAPYHRSAWRACRSPKISSDRGLPPN